MMRKSFQSENIGTSWLALLLLAIAVLASAPLLMGATSTVTTTVTVVNNSSREIRHIYFSPSNQDDWGPDQLNSSVIGQGGSYTLNNVSCEGADIKIIAEDQDGCFITRTVTCSQNTNWTITNETARDCGN
jgi:hypothetical protein